MKQGQAMGGIDNYRPPQGPKTPTDPKGPGLHGDNLDYCGSQERDSLKTSQSGSPGIGGSSNCCTQGKH